MIGGSAISGLAGGMGAGLMNRAFQGTMGKKNDQGDYGNGWFDF
jgi:hypothetical protein